MIALALKSLGTEKAMAKPGFFEALVESPNLRLPTTTSVVQFCANL